MAHSYNFVMKHQNSHEGIESDCLPQVASTEYPVEEDLVE